MAKTIYNGNLAGSTDAVHMPVKAFQNCYVKAHPANTGNVYIGSSSDVVASGTTDTNTTGGFVPDASEIFLPGAPGDLSDYWYICDNATDTLCYYVENF